jgi:diguanylate cyclase (GGDEF)-like protein
MQFSLTKAAPQDGCSESLTLMNSTVLGIAGPLVRLFNQSASPYAATPPATHHTVAALGRGTIWRLLASLVVLGLLVAVITCILVLQLREQALTEAKHELRSLSLTLADQAERAFEAVDLVQTTFMEMVRADGIRTPEEFRDRMSSLEVHNELDAHGSALPQLDIIGLVDPDGKFINISHSWPAPKVNISDRPYFQALKAETGQTTIISDPIVNRVTHTLAVVLAHNVISPDGRFLGISFGGVLMSYFENLYKTVTNNEDTAISLFRKDGILLARYPHINDSIGKSFAQGGITGRLAASGADSDVTLQTSRIDGLERLIAGHTLAHYPMVVSVSASVSSILAPWREQAAYLIAAAVILELVVAAVGILMLRQLRGQRMLAEAHAARRDAEAELALGHERERADRELHIQAARFGAALGKMSEVLCLFDTGDSLVVGNDRLAAILGLPESSIAPGTSIEDLRVLLSGASALLPKNLDQIHRRIVRLRTEGKRASEVQDLDDGRRLAVNFAPMDNDGWLITLEDITEQRLAEAKIAYMAHHDALTGLANRVLFHDRLDEAVARSRRGIRSSVMYLDLDHFKAVNDTLGHPVGDALLREVTQRLQQQVRDIDTVARLGGDEFAIVQPIEQPTDSTALAKRLIEAVSAPYEFNGNRVIIGTSIGIAIIPDDGEDADLLMKSADMALYRSKAEGRGQYRFFEPEMDTVMQARRTLDLDLRNALVAGEFRIFYQPLIDIASRSISGFEALLRWVHPKRGMVSPLDFIPLAEEIGLIVPLGAWVLRQACADAATWPGNLKVAVNLSPVQFGSHVLVEDVAAALSDSGLDPGSLELEITETAMLADTDAVLVTLHQLRDLGVQIALDDFGTGYSSLSHLQRFPFSKVKIDRSFVAKLGQGGNNDTIVAAVVDLCSRLGMVTTGEGVETAAQLDHLASLNCTEAQGYLFGQPRPSGEVETMLGLYAQTLEIFDSMGWGEMPRLSVFPEVVEAI